MKPFSPLVAVCLSALLAAPGFADTTSEIFIRSGGVRGLGAFEGVTTRSLQGLKSHEDANLKFTGGLMKFAGGPRNGQTVVRVDLDKIWALNPKKKTYTERPITPPPVKRSPDEAEPEESGEPADEEPTHRIKKAGFDVKKTGAKKALNGFNTEENVVSLTVEVEEIATREVTTYRMENHLWMTPWTGPLKQHVEEEKRFARAYLKKMGGDLAPADAQAMGEAALRTILGLGGEKTANLLNQVKAKTAAIDGYPIVTDSRWSVEEDPRAVQRKKAEAAAEEEDDAGLDLSGGAKGIAGGLMGAFAKKKMKQHQEKKAAERDAKPVFSTYTELKRIAAAPVKKEIFEVPAGYKKR